MTIRWHGSRAASLLAIGLLLTGLPVLTLAQGTAKTGPTDSASQTVEQLANDRAVDQEAATEQAAPEPVAAGSATTEPAAAEPAAAEPAAAEPAATESAAAEPVAVEPVAVEQAAGVPAAAESAATAQAAAEQAAAEPAAVEGAAASERAGVEASRSVARAVFTTQIVEREPIDDLTAIPPDTDEVYFFSELRGLEGHTITHRWQYEGAVMAEVTFPIGGPRWRVYSSKKLLPEWAGEWTVTVTDEAGSELGGGALQYGQALAAKQ